MASLIIYEERGLNNEGNTWSSLSEQSTSFSRIVNTTATTVKNNEMVI